MHPIDVGIGGDYDIVVPQVFHAFFDIEGSLQKVKLLVFIYDFLAHPIGIQRFPP